MLDSEISGQFSWLLFDPELYGSFFKTFQYTKCRIFHRPGKIWHASTTLHTRQIKWLSPCYVNNYFKTVWSREWKACLHTIFFVKIKNFQTQRERSELTFFTSSVWATFNLLSRWLYWRKRTKEGVWWKTDVLRICEIKKQWAEKMTNAWFNRSRYSTKSLGLSIS